MEGALMLSWSMGQEELSGCPARFCVRVHGLVVLTLKGLARTSQSVRGDPTAWKTSASMSMVSERQWGKVKEGEGMVGWWDGSEDWNE